ncbi:MAG: C10 family peptidase [Bacteroidales bacterium]|nr:C10 family peptidase [Bacteroidales bacterium]
MKKTLVTTLALAAICSGAGAQKITEQQAMSRALRYLDGQQTTASAIKLKKAAGTSATTRKMTAARVATDGIYAFNVEGGGFVIASADERALPVLGYSDSGTFDWDNLPDNMRAWLASYDEALATLGDRKEWVDGNAIGQELKNTRAEKSAIAPLITTQWDQLEPYWNDIPLYAGTQNDAWLGKNCLTCCVATAMAQVMAYHQWPKAATKDIPAYDVPDDEWHIDSLPPVTFDWENMRDQYVVADSQGQDSVVGSEAEQKAVSTLMRYCSQSIKTALTPEWSSSNGDEMTRALIQYFDYAPTTRWIKRFAYGIDEWESLVYDELAAGRPVPYGGIGNVSGGHEFICDGYDGDGFFHINWGWGGYADGYFSLSVLNPFDVSEDGFALDQDVIVGLMPNDGGEVSVDASISAHLSNPSFVIVDGLLQYTISVFSGLFELEQKGKYSISSNVWQDYAMGTLAADGTMQPLFFGNPSDSLIYVYEQWWLAENFDQVKIDSTAFQQGDTLVLYPMIRFRGTDFVGDWRLLANTDYCAYAGRSADDGRFFLYQSGETDLELLDIAITPDDCAAESPCELTLTLRNNGNLDYTGMIGIAPYYYGHDYTADEITDETPYIETDDFWICEAYLRAGAETQVPISGIRFSYGGVLCLMVYDETYNCLGTILFEISDAETGITRVVADRKSERRYVIGRDYDLYGRRINNK